MLEVENRLTLPEVRVGQHLRRIEHCAAHDAASGKRFHDLALLALPGPALDLRGQRRAVAGTRRWRRKTVVGAQIRAPDDLGHRLEHLRIIGWDGYVDIVVRPVARAA